MKIGHINVLRACLTSFRRLALQLAVVPLHATLWCGGQASAAPHGELDGTFGDNGRLTIQLAGTIVGTAIRQQPADGKLLVSGYTLSTEDDHDFAIFRTHPDGSLDESFGVAGIVTVDFAGADDKATEIALQADGKIMVAGEADMGATGTDFALARFDPDGTIDTTFDGDGRVTLDLGGAYENIAGIALLESGQSVVTGVTSNFLGGNVAFARFDADGALDTAFGTGSIAGTTLVDSGGNYDEPSALIRQQDGKYLACGSSDIPELVSQADMLAVRVNPDGSLDTGFGMHGVSKVDTGQLFAVAKSCVAMPNGAIILAGFHGEPGKVDLAMARLLPSGIRDTTFGNAGISSIEVGRISWVNAIALLDDNRLGVTGATYDVRNTNVPTYMFFALIDPDSGWLDPNFGNNGATIIDFGRGNQPSVAEGLGLIQQADGKLIAVGSAIYPGMGAAVALARVDPAASGNQGWVGFTMSFAGIEEGISSIVLSVRRSGGSIGEVSADYNTVAESAQAPGDFSAASGTVTWMSGDVDTKHITVPITNDSTVEDVENFSVVLSNSTSHLASSEFLVSISDDDRIKSVVPAGDNTSGGGVTGIELLMVLAIGAAAGRCRQRDKNRASPIGLSPIRQSKAANPRRLRYKRSRATANLPGPLLRFGRSLAESRLQQGPGSLRNTWSMAPDGSNSILCRSCRRPGNSGYRREELLPARHCSPLRFRRPRRRHAPGSAAPGTHPCGAFFPVDR